MIIDSSQIQLSAEHHKLEIHQQSRHQQGFLLQLDAARLRLTDAQARVQLRADGPMHARADARSDQTDNRLPPGLSRLIGLDGFSPGNSHLIGSPWQPGGVSLTDNNATESGRDRLFQALLDAITRRTGEMASRWPAIADAGTQTVSAASAAETAQTAELNDGNQGWQLPRSGRQRLIEVEVNLRDYIREEECTRFCAGGSVTTRDGETLDFSLSLEMSRSYEAITETRVRETVVFTDPLMVNFDGHAAELSDDKYAFDLDADGTAEWINFAGSHSALLALDQNGDGQINDGSELFGALSGNGFADLAAYDDDGNGFIDEADPIFEQLLLWRKEAGEDQLESLSERNIGAIYLGATETPFTLKDNNNQTLGQVRQSGIYLTENGDVGTLQQVDLAV
ncbi:hypothetical protein [Motiliproteus sediminis]|uniref:hypothetical protein n=1 Tax=Motiliproteus sediminis TaxID=1468178 RepID=UPI001AEFC10B|nr:hypothetical protein [Motiliproteus sediminis]